MVRVAAFSAAFLNFIGAVLPVMALDKATVAQLVFVDDLPLVIGVGVLQHRAVECWWVRPFSVHQAHQNSFNLGEASRLLGALGARCSSFGMLMLNVEA